METENVQQDRIGSHDIIRSRAPSEPAIEPSDRHAPFGPPPLIEGEDAAAYDHLRDHVAGAVKPRDFLEEIRVRDVVDLSWECLRLRRLKARLFTAAMSDGIRHQLEPHMGFREASELASQWAVRDEEAMKGVDKQLREVRGSLETAAVSTMIKNIDTVERMDRMMMSAEARRNAALREMERHRSNLAAALRRASDEVVEAEFEDVEPGTGGEREVA